MAAAVALFLYEIVKTHFWVKLISINGIYFSLIKTGTGYFGKKNENRVIVICIT